MWSLWLVLLAPGNPVFGHGFDIAPTFWLNRRRVGDLVEGVEPVIGALGQPFEQPWDSLGADVNDALVRRVSDHLGDVCTLGALLEPFVGQSFELLFVNGQAGVDFGCRAVDG